MGNRPNILYKLILLILKAYDKISVLNDWLLISTIKGHSPQAGGSVPAELGFQALLANI
jgi:hypothetical protein